MSPDSPVSPQSAESEPQSTAFSRKGPLAQWQQRREGRDEDEKVIEEDTHDKKARVAFHERPQQNSETQPPQQPSQQPSQPRSRRNSTHKVSAVPPPRKNRKRASMQATVSRIHEVVHAPPSTSPPAHEVDHDELLQETLSLRQQNSDLRRELDVITFEYEKIYKFVILHMKESSFSVENEFLEWRTKTSPREAPQQDQEQQPNTTTLNISPQTSEQTIQIYQKNLSALKQQMELKMRMKDKIIAGLHETITEHESTNVRLQEQIQDMQIQMHELVNSNRQFQKEVEHLTADQETAQRQLVNLESMLLKKDHLIAEYRKENQATEKQYKTQIKQKDSVLHEIKKMLIKDLKQKYEMRQEDVTPMTIRSIQKGQLGGADGASSGSASVEEHSSNTNVSVTTLIKDRTKQRRDTPSSVEMRLHQLTSVENFSNHLAAEVQSLLAKRDFWKRKALSMETKLKQQETLTRHNLQKAVQLEQTARKVEQQNQMINGLTEQLKQLKAVLKEKFMGVSHHFDGSVAHGSGGSSVHLPPVAPDQQQGGAYSVAAQQSQNQHINPVPPAEKRTSRPHRNAPKSAPTGGGGPRRRRMTEPAPNVITHQPTERDQHDFPEDASSEDDLRDDLSDIDEDAMEIDDNMISSYVHNALPPPRNPLDRSKHIRRRASDSDFTTRNGTGTNNRWRSFNLDNKKPASLITIHNVDLDGAPTIIDPRGIRTAPNQFANPRAPDVPFMASIAGAAKIREQNNRRLRLQSKFKSKYVHNR